MEDHGKAAPATRGRQMEGLLASWYARLTRNDMVAFRQEAARIAQSLPSGARILEIAPGPGYLAIELARRGRYTIDTVDISRTFVRIAQRNVTRAGVTVSVHHGDAHHLPFDAAQFDVIVCRAAFKNFAYPVEALQEMRRVLRPDGQALILDLRRDVTDTEIDDFVEVYTRSWLNRMIIRRTFKTILRPRAYLAEEFRRMAVQAGFAGCDIRREPISLEVRLVH